jgi:mitogen-activated protein kinase 15
MIILFILSIFEIIIFFRSVAFNEEEGSDPVLTEYVATRWYRAPEILLGSTKYTKAVDMWSVGCIIGELIIGKAIFPGTSTLNQIERVLELTGKPKVEDINSLESDLAHNILSSISISKTRSYSHFFPNATEDALDLIKKLLAFNPKNRLTVEQALKHRYVRDFICEEEEIVMTEAIKIPMDDNKKFTIREYREALYADITLRKKE